MLGQLAAQVPGQGRAAEQAGERINATLLAHAAIVFQHAGRGADPGEQLAIGDGFDQEVVDARLQRVLQLTLVRILDQKELERAGTAGLLRQQAAQFPVGSGRQLGVEQQDLRRSAAAIAARADCRWAACSTW